MSNQAKYLHPNFQPRGPSALQLAEEGEQVAPEHRIGVLQLDAYKCRWPIGTPGNIDFRFCGKRPGTDSPYCRSHEERAFTGGHPGRYYVPGPRRGAAS